VEENVQEIRVVIALRPATEPIEGELIEPSALAGPFRGWLALARLIESARSDAEVKPPGTPDASPRARTEDQGGSPM
jgi:hypothetical protein